MPVLPLTYGPVLLGAVGGKCDRHRREHLGVFTNAQGCERGPHCGACSWGTALLGTSLPRPSRMLEPINSPLSNLLLETHPSSLEEKKRS